MVRGFGSVVDESLGNSFVPLCLLDPLHLHGMLGLGLSRPDSCAFGKVINALGHVAASRWSRVVDGNRVLSRSIGLTKALSIRLPKALCICFRQVLGIGWNALLLGYWRCINPTFWSILFLVVAAALGGVG
jgi:hypothetical protein